MFQLPPWCRSIDPGLRPDTVEQVRFAIALARRNVEEETGGPFGAAIFEIGTGRCVAFGVNLVVPTNSAIAHAEIVAIARAGRERGTFDLGADGQPGMVLATSTEPCAMCFGAVPWSGVRRLATGARDEDARAIGFDEGPKMEGWRAALEARGIEVVTDVARDEGAAVLADYLAGGGDIYNGRSAG